MIYTVTLNPALDKEYKVPQIVFDDIMRMTSMRIDFGGKGFNVSRMLQSLGAKNVALGFVGGHTGEVISAGLESLAIAVDLTPIQGETRTNISIVDQAENHYVKLNEAGPYVTQAEIDALLEKVDTLVSPGDFWVLAGSIPNGVPEDIYARIIRKINQAEAHAVLDTSGLPLQLGVEEKPFLIKPNVHELSALLGVDIQDPHQLPQYVADLHAQGIPNILVSLGDKGAFLSDSQHCWTGQTPQITAQNPIGAGDAMVAGMVWRLAEGDAIDVALPWAMACGTAAASLPGTGMPSLSLVSEFHQAIKIEEL
ncbi:MAG: 1-phosphofructokinase [Bacteroides sp.]|jgi:1-phosphofructokinase family hexose kinase|nr:1-phosphofructokinase [Bacteroides sp.]